MARKSVNKGAVTAKAPTKSATPRKAKAMAQDAVTPRVIEAAAAQIETPAAAIPAAPVETVNTNKGTKTMTDVKNFAADVAEKATTAFKDVQAKAKDAFAKSGELTKDVVEFHKGNAEAMIESAKVAAASLQTAAQDGAAQGRKNWDASIAHFKALTAVKSPSEFLKLQGEFARHQFDGAVADFSKATEFAVKLSGDVISPIQNRYAVVSEQVKARLAA